MSQAVSCAIISHITIIGINIIILIIIIIVIFVIICSIVMVIDIATITTITTITTILAPRRRVAGGLVRLRGAGLAGGSGAPTILYYTIL